MSGEDTSVLEYRLNQIDDTLGQLRGLLAKNLLQDRDIEDLKKRITKAEDDINCIRGAIRVLEMKEVNKKAKVIDTVLSKVGNIIMTLVITAILIMLGLDKFAK